MTTKPKARKFRVRRSAGPASGGAGANKDAGADKNAGAGKGAGVDKGKSPDGGAGVTRSGPLADRARQVASRSDPRRSQSTKSAAAASDKPSAPAKSTPTQAATGDVVSPSSGGTDIDTIRREGLTGRQLRMARRVAQKYDLAPTSDFDAVRLLRDKGIDPFQRANMLELVVPQSGQGTAAGQANPQRLEQSPQDRVQLPQTTPSQEVQLPSKTVSPAERRQREISEIQRDITRRRRKKMGLLLVWLAFFVFLPAVAAGYYFYQVATPMYATNSQFLIIQSEGGGGGSALGGLLPTQFATGQDSIATQAYLQSKDALQRLDADANFKQHFSDPDIDPIQRLDKDASNTDAYKLYKKNVKIGFDPTEGVIRMEVVAADPAVSAAFSESLIKYAEQRVNDLSKQKRADGMRDAQSGFEQAQIKRRTVQEQLIKLQIENGVDPEAEIIAIRAQITNYEGLLIEKQLSLAALLDNARPNKAKVDGARGDVRRLEEQLSKLNDKLNSATKGEDSLAQRAVELQLAQADLAAADMVLQSAQTAMDSARTEANRQVRYLTVAVRPVAPDEPTYPRKFENTILAFLIFAGIYLMLSLTASILREQVTS